MLLYHHEADYSVVLSLKLPLRREKDKPTRIVILSARGTMKKTLCKRGGNILQFAHILPFFRSFIVGVGFKTFSSIFKNIKHLPIAKNNLFKS